MNRRTTIALGTTALLGFGLALSGSAVAQQKSLKEQITGTWLLVSAENVLPDGKTRQLFGSDPKGSLSLDANGRYTQVYITSGLPKFKANNRLEGTPEENQVVVRGTTAQFGTWTLDEASRTLTMSSEGSMYPNGTGTNSKRTVALVADELKINNPTPGAGGKSETVFKRAK
jgi:Lipocalin-like domain